MRTLFILKKGLGGTCNEAHSCCLTAQRSPNSSLSLTHSGHQVLLATSELQPRAAVPSSGPCWFDRLDVSGRWSAPLLPDWCNLGPRVLPIWTSVCLPLPLLGHRNSVRPADWRRKIAATGGRRLEFVPRESLAHWPTERPSPCANRRVPASNIHCAKATLDLQHSAQAPPRRLIMGL